MKTAPPQPPASKPAFVKKTPPLPRISSREPGKLRSKAARTMPLPFAREHSSARGGLVADDRAYPALQFRPSAIEVAVIQSAQVRHPETKNARRNRWKQPITHFNFSSLLVMRGEDPRRKKGQTAALALCSEPMDSTRESPQRRKKAQMKRLPKHPAVKQRENHRRANAEWSGKNKYMYQK